MRRPRLLDLFAGAGGCSIGYAQAGFDVYAVDADPVALRRNPYAGHVGDAIEALSDPGFISRFDAIHASPPCQHYSRATTNGTRDSHPDLLPLVRELLRETGKPYVIENVPGSPMPNALMLCGTMFGLTAYDPATKLTLALRRHRLFESEVFLYPPANCDHFLPVGGVYGGGSADRSRALLVRRGGYTPANEVRRELMGLDHMTREQLSQAIPPAYTEYIGGLILDSINIPA